MPVAKIVIYNQELANSLDIDLASEDQSKLADYLSGNLLMPGSEPIAQAYAGHQFGHFTMLGDGRAVLLGEHLTKTGERYDIQLKGSGQTPYSRRGDGRAALNPMLREYLISEAMHHLGIPTTRSLAVVTTGEDVYRDKILTGAILTRIANSHIRIGTFEYAYMFLDIDHLREFTDYVIARHYPDAALANNPYLEFFKLIVDRQASLLANWQAIGFVHGVMNTDNISIAGETIDYGPCAFIDKYDPLAVFSSIDRDGRYAFDNQPYIAKWNLARLAETLLPLFDSDLKKSVILAEQEIENFTSKYETYYLAKMSSKLGIFRPNAKDLLLTKQLLKFMEEFKIDYTYKFYELTYRELSKMQDVNQEFINWYEMWQNRLTNQEQNASEVNQLMQLNNPVVIPRNYLVEEALHLIESEREYSLFYKLNTNFKTPYVDDKSEFSVPAPRTQESYQTFCGT